MRLFQSRSVYIPSYIHHMTHFRFSDILLCDRKNQIPRIKNSKYCIFPTLTNVFFSTIEVTLTLYAFSDLTFL